MTQPFERLFRSQIWRKLRLFLRRPAGVPGVAKVSDGPHVPLETTTAAATNSPAERTNDRSRTHDATPALRKRLVERNQKLKRARRRIAQQEQTLAELRSELALLSSAPRRGDVPVFFVLGVGKSGTSWLMRMLDSHPEILCKGEGQFFGADWRHEDRKQHPNKLVSSLYNALLSAEYVRLWIERSVWTRDGDADEHLVKLTHAAIQHFLSEQLSRSGRKTVGDKLLLMPKAVEEVRLIYPEAKIIHIIRDGRDQALSMIHHLWNRAADKGGFRRLTAEEIRKRDSFRENPEEFLRSGESIFSEKMLRRAAEGWASRVATTVEVGPSLFGDNYKEVFYEDLLERPHQEMTELARFLGVETRENFIEQAVNSASFETLSEGRKRGEEDATSFFRKGVAGDWRNVFTVRDRELYKEVAGDLLVRLGYEKDHDW